MAAVNRAMEIGNQGKQPIEFDEEWVVVAEVTNTILEENFSLFSQLAGRLTQEFKGKQVGKVVSELVLPTTVEVTGRKVNNAKESGNKELREGVNEQLEFSIVTIAEVFNREIVQLNTDLQKVLNEPENWGLNSGLQAYPKGGVRAFARKFLAKNRGSAEDVHKKLTEKLREIEGSFVSGEIKALTVFEKSTIKLIESAMVSLIAEGTYCNLEYEI